ncbi:MAG: amino-acid N-acetyltransferase [Cellvibrionales bacterium]|nr:amino-acid N-acetyltransferase [Cellvibrionales bacterium]
MARSLLQPGASVQQVPDSFIHWFRFAAPYLQKHRDATFVIALPGEAAAHPNFLNLAQDLSLLQSLGARLILVQGARAQIDAALTAVGIDAPLEAGVRVSTAAAMPHIIAATNAVRTELERALSAGLLGAPRLRTVSGNFVVAKPVGVRDGVDYLLTGLVRQVDRQAIERALYGGALAIVPTLGFSATGEVFNLSLGDCATQVAKAVGADKIIALLGEQRLRPLLEQQSVVLPARAQQLAAVEMGEAGLLHAVAAAVDAGIERAHLVSYEANGALLRELFTHDGAGLLIARQEPVQVRTASAADVGYILELIQPLQESGVLVQRSRELLEAELDRFAVLDIDGTAIGCAALHPLDEQAAEIACVAVQPEFQGRGYAGRLLEFQEQRAIAAAIKRLFVLSTQATHWFIERGYRETPADDLPAARRAQYSTERKPRVLVKLL